MLGGAGMLLLRLVSGVGMDKREILRNERVKRRGKGAGRFDSWFATCYIFQSTRLKSSCLCDFT